MGIQQDYADSSLDPSTTGQTQLGPVSIHRFGGSVRAKLVTVLAGSDDVDFNVNLGGNALFSATQTIGTSEVFEEFTPDQNQYASGAGVGLEFDVTAASSGATTSTLFTSVLLETTSD